MLRKPNMLCQEMVTFPTRHLLLIHIDRMTRMLLECLPCLNLYWSKPWSAIAQSRFGSFSSLTHGCAFPADLPTGNVHEWQCGGLIVTVYMYYMVTIISMTLRVWLCPIISLDYCCTILTTQCLLFGVYILFINWVAVIKVWSFATELHYTDTWLCLSSRSPHWEYTSMQQYLSRSWLLPRLSLVLSTNLSPSWGVSQWHHHSQYQLQTEWGAPNLPCCHQRHPGNVCSPPIIITADNYDSPCRW